MIYQEENDDQVSTVGCGAHSGSGDRGSRTKLLPLLIILAARTIITQVRSTHRTATHTALHLAILTRTGTVPTTDGRTLGPIRLRHTGQALPTPTLMFILARTLIAPGQG